MAERGRYDELEARNASNAHSTHHGRIQDSATGKTRTRITNNNNVRSTESIKLLGVYIDSSLNWCCHIDKLCAKISSQIFLLRRLKHILNTELLINLYFALIHSNLNYGIILWGNCSAAEQAFKLGRK
nr:unnamed protein product [Callosobruchus analis]